MAALFGEDQVDALQRRLDDLAPPEREAAVVEALAQALKANGHKFVLPFTFKNERGTRTTHHLILVSKHFKAYEVMKDIMAKSSSNHDQGVPSFMYMPAASQRQQLLFELSRPLDELQGMLLRDFAGQSLTMRQIYESHSVDRPFIAKNYKDVLRSMEIAQKIGVDRPKLSKTGFADHLKVTFPPR